MHPKVYPEFTLHPACVLAVSVSYLRRRGLFGVFYTCFYCWKKKSRESVKLARLLTVKALCHYEILCYISFRAAVDALNKIF